MSGLYVWTGRWCALDAGSGRVEGWRRRARFVYRARGQLVLAPRNAVLRGLRALLAGAPTSVHNGPQVSQRRVKNRPRRHLCVCPHHHNCCTAQHNLDKGCTNTNKKPSKVAIEEVLSPPTTDIGVQVTQSLQTIATHLPESQPLLKSRAKRKRSSSSEPMVVKQKMYADVHRTNSGNTLLTNVRQNKSQPLSQKATQSQTELKELIINEDSVDLYRSYLIDNDPNFDIYRFDTDEKYKVNMFIKINPLVSITRCKQLERMLQGSRGSQMSQKDFATNLGLRSVSEQESERPARYKMRNRMERVSPNLMFDEETDKENQIEVPRRDSPKRLLRAKKILKEHKEKERNVECTTRKNKSLLSKPRNRNYASNSTEGREREVIISDSGSDFEENELHPPKQAETVKKIPIKYSMSPQPRKRTGINAYSPMEDHAIVTWVSNGSRARLVNGNRVWRELQEQYCAITGQRRSWHSLRNRYLRYILPSLGALALDPTHAARLRADASAGEVKKKNAPRRNSIFGAPAAPSAFARRPPHTAHPASDEAAAQTSRRVLRSSGVSHDPTPRPDPRPLSLVESSDSQDDSKEINDHQKNRHNDIKSRKSRDKLSNQSSDESDSSKSDHPNERDKKLNRSAKRDSTEGSTDQSSDSSGKKDRPRDRGATSNSSDDSLVQSRKRRSVLRNRSNNVNRSRVDSSVESRDRRASLRDRSNKIDQPSDKRGRRDESDKREIDQVSDRRGILRDRSKVVSSAIVTENKRNKKRERRDSSSDEDFHRKKISTPIYDQPTRQFAKRLRSTPNERDMSATESEKRPKERSERPQRRRQLYNPNAPKAASR